MIYIFAWTNKVAFHSQGSGNAIIVLILTFGVMKIK
jgi:hypothetical protein